MPNYPQSLLFTDGWQQAWLRELTGREEQRIAGTHVTEAIDLIDRLLVKGHRSAHGAKELTAPDRDRVLAAVYQRTYGDRIAGTLECTQCGSPYDLDFSLGDYVRHAHAEAVDGAAKRLQGGTYRMGDDLEIRIPTGEDELAVMSMDGKAAAEALLKRCLVQGEIPHDTTALESALLEAAPVLQTEMAATCPECGHDASVLFDIQGYLLQSLLNDQERLTWEIHRLASAYGWSLKEILKLPRSMRRSYARLIEAEIVMTN